MTRRPRRPVATFSLLLALAMLAPTRLPAQTGGGRLSLESIYGASPASQVNYSGQVPSVTWISDAVMAREDASAWIHFDENGDIRPAVANLGTIAAALADLPGLTQADVAALAEAAQEDLAVGAEATLVNHANDLFYVSAAGEARRLTFDVEAEVGEELSPDGRFVSFVRDYNIYLIELASGRERQLTKDGNDELFYGRLDWVYQEEVYGRGNFKGYWWSPDSSALAFLKLDESPVREFTVVDHMPTTLETEVTNYPKAGDPNPRVWLGVVKAAGGETVWIDTRKYEPIEHLIVEVDWNPDGSRVVFQVQNREQTWLDLNMGDPTTGAVATLIHERTEAFVQAMGSPYWLADGSFLWFSERTGYKHLYHYGFEGSEMPQMLHQATSGEWEARSLYGVSADGWIYFSGTEHSPIAEHIYRVRADGTGLERLSQREGSHRANFNPGFTRYLDTWSDVNTPPQVRLHAADGRELQVIAANSVPELAALELGDVDFLQVPTRDGFVMEAMMIRPPDFDPTRRYPVLVYNYGGPHAPVVRNSWGGTTYMWHQHLAQQGYVIWYCDNRSASGKGIAPTWEAYRQLGVVELRDTEDGLDWLRQQPYVDAERFGIWGWSYGGFMSAYALTHSKSFRVGIAGAPVTDWRLYDTIYTERYMGMPQNNEEGYASTSVVNAAANLHGKLLLLHGTMDDNVHMQNSVQLIYGLQQAGKDFDLMIYPRSRHGIREADLVWHLRRKMTDFLLENL